MQNYQHNSDVHIGKGLPPQSFVQKKCHDWAVQVFQATIIVQ